MSPEQANGEVVDQRTDIFSTGIILFEILTRQRLFQSSNDLNILKKVQECKIPAPSLFNPDIPFELEEIVLKALEKDRDKRYQTAQDFHRDLSRFLNTLNPDFTASHTATFVKSLFALDILDQKKKMNNILISLSPIQKPTPIDQPETPPEIEVKTKSKTIGHKNVDISDHNTRTDIHVVQDQAIVDADAASVKKMWFQLSLMGLAIMTLSVMLLVLNKSPDRVIQSTDLKRGEAPIQTTPKPKYTTLRIETEPAGADVLLDNKQVGQTPLSLPHLTQHTEQTLVLQKKGFEPVQQRLFLTTPQHHIKKVLIPVGVGYLNVRTVPESDIVIDGKPVGRSPIIRFPATAGKHKIRAINKELNLSAEKEIYIKKGEEHLLDEKDLIFQPIPSE